MKLAIVAAAFALLLVPVHAQAVVVTPWCSQLGVYLPNGVSVPPNAPGVFVGSPPLQLSTGGTVPASALQLTLTANEGEAVVLPLVDIVSGQQQAVRWTLAPNTAYRLDFTGTCEERAIAQVVNFFTAAEPSPLPTVGGTPLADAFGALSFEPSAEMQPFVPLALVDWQIVGGASALAAMNESPSLGMKMKCASEAESIEVTARARARLPFSEFAPVDVTGTYECPASGPGVGASSSSSSSGTLDAGSGSEEPAMPETTDGEGGCAIHPTAPLSSLGLLAVIGLVVRRWRGTRFASK